MAMNISPHPHVLFLLRISILFQTSFNFQTNGGGTRLPTHPVPSFQLLTSYISVVHLSQFMNRYYTFLLTEVYTSFKFPQCSCNVLLLFQDTTFHLVIMSTRLLWALTGFQTFLVFDNLGN